MDNDKLLQNAKIQKFIQRLYAFVNDSSVNDIVWSESGTSVIIPNKEEFKKNTMKKISHTNEYTAFLRSLHHYGFIKLKRVEENSDEYCHPNFLRNKSELLQEIKRIKPKKGAKEVNDLKKEIMFLQNNSNITNQNLYNINEEVNYLRVKVEKQEQTINGLIEVLSKAFKIGLANDGMQPALKGNTMIVDNYVKNNDQINKNILHNNNQNYINNQISYEMNRYQSNDLKNALRSDQIQKKRNVAKRDAIQYQKIKEDKNKQKSKEKQEEIIDKDIEYKPMPDFETSKKDDDDDFFKDLYY